MATSAWVASSSRRRVPRKIPGSVSAAAESFCLPFAVRCMCRSPPSIAKSSPSSSFATIASAVSYISFSGAWSDRPEMMSGVRASSTSTLSASSTIAKKSPRRTSRLARLSVPATRSIDSWMRFTCEPSAIRSRR